MIAVASTCCGPYVALAATHPGDSASEALKTTANRIRVRATGSCSGESKQKVVLRGGVMAKGYIEAAMNRVMLRFDPAACLFILGPGIIVGLVSSSRCCS